MKGGASRKQQEKGGQSYLETSESPCGGTPVGSRVTCKAKKTLLDPRFEPGGASL